MTTRPLLEPVRNYYVPNVIETTSRGERHSDLYSRMLRRGVPDDEANPAAARIKMSGVAWVKDGILRPRNRIYARVFDRGWIGENTPGQELRRQRRAYWTGVFRTGAISTVVVSVVGTLAWYNYRLRNTAEASERRAKASEARANYEAYISSMRLLPDLWEQGSVEGIRRILDRYRESPYRGWEWDYWYRQTGGDLWEAALFANRIAAASVTRRGLRDKMAVIRAMQLEKLRRAVTGS